MTYTFPSYALPSKAPGRPLDRSSERYSASLRGLIAATKARLRKGHIRPSRARKIIRELESRAGPILPSARKRESLFDGAKKALSKFGSSLGGCVMVYQGAYFFDDGSFDLQIRLDVDDWDLDSFVGAVQREFPRIGWSWGRFGVGYVRNAEFAAYKEGSAFLSQSKTIVHGEKQFLPMNWWAPLRNSEIPYWVLGITKFIENIASYLDEDPKSLMFDVHRSADHKPPNQK